MAIHTTRKAKLFIVNALLDLPGDDAEWLAVIRSQITQMGRVINERDPEMMHHLVDYFESSPTPVRKMKIKQRLAKI